MRPVLPNQEYTYHPDTFAHRARSTLRVDWVSGDWTHGTILETGAAIRVYTSTLARGSRATKLVREADGAPVAANATRLACARRITHRMREAAKLASKGVQRGELAERYGVIEQTIMRWCQMVREEGGR